MSNAFLTPILWLINPYYFYLRFMRFWTELRFSKSKATQKELNELFENPSMDVALKYSHVIKTIILTCLYIPLLPVAVLISAVGLIFAYLVEKVKLTKVNF